MNLKSLCQVRRRQIGFMLKTVLLELQEKMRLEASMEHCKEVSCMSSFLDLHQVGVKEYLGLLLR